MPSDEEVDETTYSYTTEHNQLEEENKNLRETISHLDKELSKLKSPALMVCKVISASNEKDEAVIKIPNGNKFLCKVSSECDDLETGDQVVVEKKNLNIIRKIDLSNRFDVEKFVIMEDPEETWDDIGGLDKEIREVKEVIELPLNNPEKFENIGISPPKGLLLHGPPGTGKTLLAKAVANSTDATFIEVAGSELVQKFIGEGAKLIKEIFKLAQQKAPSIIFIDELDALASKRMEMGTSGEREVNRTFMQLLAEIDGFQPLDDVKVIAATNRKDVLDKAITRPGRLDRLIEVGLPEKEEIKEILKIHSKDINFSEEMDLDDIVSAMEGFTGAEIRAAVTEAGYFSIRDDRDNVNQEDIMKAVDKVSTSEDKEENYMDMFG